MVKRLSSKLLVTTSDFAPTREDLEVIGVFNPGAARFGDEVVLLVRIAQARAEKEDGFVHSPRSVLRDGRIHYEIDRLEIHPDDDGDYRKPLTVEGHRRLAFISHLELVRIASDGCTVKEIVRCYGRLRSTSRSADSISGCRIGPASEAAGPLIPDDLFGRASWEEYGVEDPRITRIGEAYHVTYVSVSSEMGVATSLMTTRDFRSFERRGVIFPCENKDVVIFPEKIGGRYWALHRPVGHISIRPLAILAASSPDLVHWGGHRYVLGCAESPGWYSKRIGAGPPPVRTPEGWLSIIHGVREQHPGDVIGEYAAGAMLTALDEPARLIALSEEPFFRAEEDYEVSGYVKNVVFPTGAVTDSRDPDRLHVYYGCADSSVAVATFSITEILGSLRRL